MDQQLVLRHNYQSYGRIAHRFFSQMIVYDFSALQMVNALRKLNCRDCVFVALIKQTALKRNKHVNCFSPTKLGLSRQLVAQINQI